MSGLLQREMLRPDGERDLVAVTVRRGLKRSPDAQMERMLLSHRCMTASNTPLCFLIIDDNPLLNRSLKNYIEAQGHRCTCLLDSTMAIEWLDDNSCDAVLSDIRMPEIDGLELTKLIREKHPSLPILISTSLGYDEELMQTALKAGADGYISKVMGPKALLMTLVQTAGRRTSPTARIAA